MRRLALFEPILELDRKREVDENGTAIDMKGLGLITLLFFFEQKLMRNDRTGVKQLISFLKKMTSTEYIIEETEYEKLARTIIQTYRPTTGRKRSYSYYDWEFKREDHIEYSILKANNFDVKTNTQFYTLDEDGLELLFATKEFYSEFQLSINQLMLRKQIEKGRFQGALRQINEMRIDVESLEDRLDKLKHEIQRSIVSEETFERYKELLEDIYGRLGREDEEFKELRSFVKEVRERLFSKDLHQKEKKSYELIVKINNELEMVHYEHSRLLDRTSALRNTTLVTAQESLYYAGIQSFNFDQDIVSTILSSPLPVDAMKGVLHPFLTVEETRLWSPLTVLAEQNITEEREVKEEAGFEEMDSSDDDHPYRKWLIQKYKELMELFLAAYEEKKGNRLSDFIEYLRINNQSSIVDQRYFYDFWLILHQRSPVSAGELEEEEGKTMLGEAIQLLEDRQLVITEGTGIVSPSPRYSIQNMDMVLEENKR
jgi:hypothetical protein